MTEQTKTSATNVTKVPPRRKLMTFRDFVETMKAGHSPVTHSARIKTSVGRSKRADTILRSVREAVARNSGTREPPLPG